MYGCNGLPELQTFYRPYQALRQEPKDWQALSPHPMPKRAMQVLH